MRRLTLLCLTILATLTLQACASASHVDFIPEGPSYTALTLAQALQDSDAGAASDVTVEDASAVRQKALANLRAHGTDAASLADALTSEFPTDVAAVPFRVEKGSYEGEPAWIVFEAWGEPGGNLGYRRVWVFSLERQEILAARSVR